MRQMLMVAALLLALGAVSLAQVPSSKHVYLVALENTSYEHIVGNSNMPYLNSLFAKGTLGTQFYANRHTSITDYLLLTSGTVPTTNDSTTSTFSVDNMVRHLLTLAKTFRVYAQELPYAGYSGLTYNAYLKRHTALPYYTDMANSSTEMKKLVPIGELTNDINNSTLPDFAIITPDANHDLHNCPNGLSACEQMADSFLKSYIAPLLATAPFQKGGDGILIIWTDEGTSTDTRCSATVLSGCGGRVVVSMVGPKVRVGYKSTKTYHHQNVLRTMLTAFGDTSFPGTAETASSMSDFFVSTTSTTSGVVISAPSSGSDVAAPVHVSAYASGLSGVSATQVYVDGTLKFSVAGSSVDTYLSLSSGSHYLTVKCWNSSGVAGSKSESFMVK